MSRDDTIGIFQFKRNGKSIYFVIHDQFIEDYLYYDYFLYKLSKDSLKWTYSFKKAMHIAKCIFKKNEFCEYGIQVFNDHKKRDIVSDTLV